ncbi:MAG: T9SS type A sorting domain-containing protein [Bacteroidales bacterium]|nr:T9SS type A sorting domain-containing protein [Bacteroidales bacterium]
MRIFLFMLLLISSIDLYSQISQGGEPLWPDSKKAKSVYQIPQKDIIKAIRSDFSDEEQIYGKKPLRVGVNHDMDISPKNAGEWITLPNGMELWRVEFFSDDAFGLSLEFDEFKLSKEAIIFLYSPDRKYILGGFNHLTNKQSGKLSTAFIPGEELILEMQVMPGEGYGDMNIGSITHAYVDIFGTSQKDGYFGNSGDCEIDINCPSGNDWQIVKNAVCRIIFKRNGVYTEICTGSLVNNTLQDETPYIYTANHCISRALEAGNAVFYFGLESEECDGVDPFQNSVWNYTISSSELLATSDSLDFSLLLLSEDVPDTYNPYYAGWSISDLPPENSVTIHHPQGDVKKISRDFDPALIEYQTISPPSWLSRGSIPGAFWRIEEWEEGTTEGGSSGAPLFNHQKYIVGNLTGGDASCYKSVNDYFSKFYFNWNYYPDPDMQLKYWLDSLKIGVISLNGMKPGSMLYMYQYLLQNPGYTKILQYIEKAGYTKILSEDGFYTFFALTDTSIEKLPEWYLNLLDFGPDYFAVEFIENYLVSGKYVYTDLLEEPVLSSFNDNNLTFSSYDDLHLNDSMLVVNDEMTLSNGIVFPIDILHISADKNYNNWNIYPNPNNGEFFIYTDETVLENLTIKLYNRMGKMVGEKYFSDTNTTLFNFSDLPSGIYIAEIQLGNNINYMKVIIVK